jgi:sigma-B regulation protein RsbU (phosphoserine phosphatase)
MFGTSAHKDKSFQTAFTPYLNRIVHEWSTTLAALCFVLVPIFFILDIFTMPQHLLKKFALYRLIATIIPLLQYFFIKKTKPGKTSYIHGYLVSLIVGGVIAIMTIDLGGFDSRYYAGINLVIIGVNILLPWEAIHSALNGVMLIVFYVVVNLIGGNDFNTLYLINNLFFMSSTVIIATSINYVRHRLIKDEFFLRLELKDARDALWGEMELAKKIQTSLLPANTRLGDYQIAAVMHPADEVGGDYYDFIETDAGERWVSIGDVSGHGVDSGLIMMMTQTGINSILNRTTALEPSEVIDHVNAVIRRNILRMKINHFMTLLVMKLEKNSIIAAGKHHDIVIYRAATASVELVPTMGTWIGIADNIGRYLRNHSIPIEVNDIILLYTDGVTEARNARGELYGEERLVKVFSENAGETVDRIIEFILRDVEQYQDHQEDDISVMVIKKIF